MPNEEAPLVVYPDFFEDLAIAAAGDLVNYHLINPNDFGKVQEMLLRRLRFQHRLHLDWKEGGEESFTRIRMDRIAT